MSIQGKRQLCDNCHAKGYVKKQQQLLSRTFPCENCKTTGDVTCKYCKGVLQVTCNMGHRHDCNCKDGKVHCPVCVGTGIRKVNEYATVDSPCYHDDRDATQCSICLGKGTVFAK